MSRFALKSGGLLIALPVLFVTAHCLADQTTGPASQGTTVGWRPTDRSIVDLLAAGYDLVTVVAASPQTRLYFLHAPGSIVRCSEQAGPLAAPPMPPSLSPGAPIPMMPPAPPDPKSLKMGITFECSELARAERGRP